MADITAVNGAGSTAGVTFNRTGRLEASDPQTSAADRAEFSEMGRLLSALEPQSQAPIRVDKVSEIREAIANGTYETDDKIEYVVNRLMGVLGARIEPISN